MKVKVIKPVQLPAGTLVKLEDALLKRFGTAVGKARGKVVECLQPVWLKAGTVVDLDNPSKHLLASLEVLDKKAATVAAGVAAVAAAVVAPPAGDEDGAAPEQKPNDPAGE